MVSLPVALISSGSSEQKAAIGLFLEAPVKVDGAFQESSVEIIDSAQVEVKDSEAANDNTIRRSSVARMW